MDISPGEEAFPTHSTQAKGTGGAREEPMQDLTLLTQLPGEGHDCCYRTLETLQGRSWDAEVLQLLHHTAVMHAA